MRRESNWAVKFATTANLMNTLSGGVILPSIKLFRNEDHYEVRVNAPSIKSDSFIVEVNNNILAISALIDVGSDPYLKKGFKYKIKGFEIPFDVDISKIYANYEDANLSVILPFNELANGYHKDVEIGDK